jgi:hypothetical protein
MSATNFEKARLVKQRFEADLLGLENVIGVGIGLRQKDGVYTDEVAVVVMVKKKVRPSELAEGDFIPEELDGVVIDVLEVGEIQAGSG